MKFDILGSIKNCYPLEITSAQDDPVVFLVISSPVFQQKINSLSISGGRRAEDKEEGSCPFLQSLISLFFISSL